MRHRMIRRGVLLIAAAGLLLGLTCSRAPRLNVLLVSFDTTRADHIGCYGHPGGVTPVLDSLAAAGVRFARAYTPVPITLPAHTSLMTGAYPPAHGVRNNGTFRLAQGFPTLAGAFEKAGYATAAFVGAFVLDSRYGLDQGFGVYDDDMLYSGRMAGILGQRERRAAVTVTRADGWLKGVNRKPFFIFVHFFDPHRPFEAPEEFARRFADPYDAEIAYADNCLGFLLAALDSLGLAQNTVIAVLGDHGEGLGDHGEMTHSTFLYNSTLHVPLIVKVPGQPLLAGKVVESPVSLVDVAPTLSALCGLTSPAKSQGLPLIGPQGLATLPAGRPLYLECWYAWYCHGWSPLEGLLRGDRKYVRAPRPELYNLAADPGELHNLADSLTAAADSLARALEVLKGGITPAEGAATAARPATESPEESARLRSLGYVSGRTAAPSRDISGLPDPKDMIGTVRNYMLGVSYMSDGRLDLAAREFEGLLTADSANWSAWEFLAEVQLQRGLADSALAASEQAIRSVSPSERAFFLLGSARMELGDSAAAAAAFDRALALNPDYGPALALRARLLDSSGRSGEALTVYLRADSLMPESPDLLTDLGELLIRLGRLDSASAVLGRAVGLAGAGWKTWFDRGVALQYSGENEAAADAYARAAQLPGATPEVFNNQGIALFSLKRYRESCQAYEKALAFNPGYAEAWNNLGGPLDMLGETEKAADCYIKALVLKPEYPDAEVNLGVLLAERLNQPDSARRVLARAVDRLPQGPRRAGLEKYLRGLGQRVPR